MKVPIALIRQVCYPTSYRLPKMSSLAWEKEPVDTPRSPYTVHRTDGFVQVHRSSFAERRRDPLIWEGNLPLEAYRFFTGQFNKESTMSTCRWCGTTFTTHDQREQHGKSTCKPSLVQAYAYLQTIERCGVCNNLTHSTKWGVPLCQPTIINNCHNEWKIRMSQATREILAKLRKKQEDEENARVLKATAAKNVGR